jgi:hypothetical protein
MHNIEEFVRSVARSQEEVVAILAQLAGPFEEEDVKWKPQSVKGSGSDKKGQAAAYADLRTYIDRLNEVVGANGWTSDSISIISGPIPKKVSKYGEDEKYVDVAKIFSTVNVMIAGVGSHCDVGESWMDDENAGTIAYAQAFKRACVAFGPGRYFYDLPKIWHPIKGYGQFAEPGPQLPEWAKPKKLCQDCGQKVVAVEIDVKGDGVLKPFTVTKIIENGKLKYGGKKLCFKCQCTRRDAKNAAGGSRVARAPNTPASKTNGKAA